MSLLNTYLKEGLDENYSIRMKDIECILDCCIFAGEENDGGYGRILGAIMSLLSTYLEEALDEPPEEFSAQTSFMDAGLDSLDLLKVNVHFYARRQPHH